MTANGLEVRKNTIGGRHWYTITHILSGTGVGDVWVGHGWALRTFRTQKDARRALDVVLPLTDWTRPAEEIARSSREATERIAALLGDEPTLYVLRARR
jgi:hypothetical protein